MRKISKLLMIVVAASFFMACSNSTIGEANYQVIPLPQEIETSEGKPFELSFKTKVHYLRGKQLLF